MQERNLQVIHTRHVIEVARDGISGIAQAASWFPKINKTTWLTQRRGCVNFKRATR